MPGWPAAQLIVEGASGHVALPGGDRPSLEMRSHAIAARDGALPERIRAASL
jgi:hypothetical protein